MLPILCKFPFHHLKKDAVMFGIVIQMRRLEKKLQIDEWIQLIVPFFPPLSSCNLDVNVQCNARDVGIYLTLTQLMHPSIQFTRSPIPSPTKWLNSIHCDTISHSGISNVNSKWCIEYYCPHIHIISHIWNEMK